MLSHCTVNDHLNWIEVNEHQKTLAKEHGVAAVMVHINFLLITDTSEPEVGLPVAMRTAICQNQQVMHALFPISFEPERASASMANFPIA